MPGVAVWWIQIGLIVGATSPPPIEAHRVALARHGQPRSALATQLPLVQLMVAYTFSGLWVLSQSLSADHTGVTRPCQNGSAIGRWLACGALRRLLV